MQRSSAKETIGCIGKCTTGLTGEQLDQITNTVNGTLANARGREIFRRYLQQKRQRLNMECLDLYETCCDFLKNSEDKSLFIAIKEMVEDLDGVPQIDFSLLERYNEVVQNNSVPDMTSVVEETMERICDHLHHTHKEFKQYICKPCPLTK